MAYLLLWSAIERFTAFAYSPRLNAADRIERFGRDQRFADALTRTLNDTERVVARSMKPEELLRLDPADPIESINYYYQVRCNLSHRGKAAYSDGETVRRSLKELYSIFRAMLADTVSDRPARFDLLR